MEIPPDQIVRAEISPTPNVQPDQITIPYDYPSNPRIIRTGYQYVPDSLQILRRSRQDGKDDDDVESKKKMKTTTQHLSLPSNLERLNKLGEYGPYFIYGMMFESLFTMDLTLLPPQQTPSETNASSIDVDNNNNEIELRTSDTARAFYQVFGNDNGSGGSFGTINLNIAGSSSATITQASLAALSTDNAGVTIAGDTPLFNGVFTVALPTNA